MHTASRMLSGQVLRFWIELPYGLTALKIKECLLCFFLYIKRSERSLPSILSSAHQWQTPSTYLWYKPYHRSLGSAPWEHLSARHEDLHYGRQQNYFHWTSLLPSGLCWHKSNEHVTTTEHLSHSNIKYKRHVFIIWDNNCRFVYFNSGTSKHTKQQQHFKWDLCCGLLVQLCCLNISSVFQWTHITCWRGQTQKCHQRDKTLEKRFLWVILLM